MSTGYDDEFLTVKEIAERLKVNPQTLRNWIDRGELPAVRIGRRVRVRRTDLERLLTEGRTVRPPTEPSTEGPTAEDFWSGEPAGLPQPLDKNGPAINDDPKHRDPS
jgi:excisionase family DNA binding protein